MKRRLLCTTGLLVALATPVLAQTESSQPTDLMQPKNGIEGTIRNDAPAATNQPGAQDAAPATQGEAPGTPPELPDSKVELPSPQGVAPGTQGEIIVEQSPTETRAEKLIGMDVTNAQGEKLATVRDVIIDQNGQISGLVVSTGGFLGLGAKPVGIAWSAVSGSQDPDRLTVHLSKEQLVQAPEFKTKEAQEDELLDLRTMEDDKLPPVTPAPANPPATD